MSSLALDISLYIICAMYLSLINIDKLIRRFSQLIKYTNKPRIQSNTLAVNRVVWETVSV